MQWIRQRVQSLENAIIARDTNKFKKLYKDAQETNEHRPDLKQKLMDHCDPYATYGDASFDMIL